MIYGLKNNKYMVINMGKEPEEVYTRRKSKRRKVQETDIYKYPDRSTWENCSP